MMTNRGTSGDGLGDNLVADMRYYEYKTGSMTTLASWQRLTKKQFVERVLEIASQFPCVDDDKNEDQQHVSVFVHGYNNRWEKAVTRYQQLQTELYDKQQLGQLVLFNWPSNGSPAGYLPDREDARDSAGAFAQELVDLHDHLVTMERAAARLKDPAKRCRAKVSIIAHSMGNYVVQKALAVAARRLNSPELITLITQLAMVAADVDNDLFQRDKAADSDGSLIANVCYRVGALYTGLDQVLGASAGLKHFGTRRLGRSGLADRDKVWDNVFDFDVSDLINEDDVHSAVFVSPKSLKLLEQILRGVDRTVLKRKTPEPQEVGASRPQGQPRPASP
ncbi:MAG: alpha/beta hydrolase [Gammaproteobacteria bacterium]